MIGYPIEATDGLVGKVKDVLFDDRHWRLALRCRGYRHLAPEEKSPFKLLPFKRIGNGLGRQLPHGSFEQGSGRRIA